MIDMFRHYGLNRTLCDVLDEMRKCIKTQNYSYLPSLIEEAQSMGNRMESGLADISDLNVIRNRIKKSKKRLKQLEEKIKEVGGEDEE